VGSVKTGEPLHIVHRDVSPQNILVGSDGTARVLDFGVAKAAVRLHSTGGAAVKGKLAYMAPEQIRGGEVDRRADVFAAGIVLWEMLTRERLFAGGSEGETVFRTLQAKIAPPSSVAPISPAFDAVVLRALQRDPDDRFQSAREMALELEACVSIANPSRVGAWVEELASEELSSRALKVREVESQSAAMEKAGPSGAPVEPPPPLAAPAPEEPEPSAHKSVVSSIDPAPPTGRATRRVAVISSVALLLALVAGAALLRRGPSASSPPPSAAASTASAPSPSSVAPAATEAAAPASSASPEAASSPTSATSSSPPLRPPPRPTYRPAPAAPTPAPKPAPAGKGVTEYVGPDGVLHFCRPPDCPK
jgi:serine/threonine-protein kinase